MASARVCDGPTCKHIATEDKPWIHVNVGRASDDVDPIAGSYDFATVECFAEWAASLLPQPEPAPEPKRKTTRKRGK